MALGYKLYHDWKTIPRVKVSDLLTLTYVPTTSAGTYDVVTRNTVTGVIEKVSSSLLGGSSITLSAIGASPNANAATLAAGVLNLEPASGSFGGVLTTGSQTIAGEKTFSSDIIIGTGDVTGTPTPSRLHSILDSSAAASNIVNTIIRSNQTAANSGSIQGIEGYVKTSNTTGSVALAIGTIGNVEHSAAGTLADARSIQGGGNITGTGPVTKWYTFYAAPAVTAASTIADVYGYYIGTFAASGGGVFTNKWGFYSSDTTAKNYFAGNTGIGTNAPGELLSVGLAGTTKGVLSLAGNTSGKITIQPQAAAGTYNFNLPTTAGTSGYLLTSLGGGSTPMSWTDPATLTGNSYATVLLYGTTTGVATVNLDFSAYTSTYDTIEIFFYGVQPVTNAVSFQVRFSADGTTFDSGAGAYGWACLGLGTGGFAPNDASASDTKGVLSGLNFVGNGSDEQVNGAFIIYNPHSSTYKQEITGRCTVSSYPAYVDFFVKRLTAQALKGIQFLFSSGNIASISYRVVGYKNPPA